MSRPETRHVPAWLETATSVAWRVLVVAAAFFVGILVLTRLAVVIIPVIGALFVAAILVPPARWLRRHGWPPLLATWATFLAAAAIVVGIGFWLVPRVTDQWDPLRQSLAKNVDDARNWMIDGPLHLEPSQVDRYANEAKDIITGTGTAAKSGKDPGASSVIGGRLLRGAASGLRLLVHFLAAMILTIVISFFFVKDGNAMGAWIEEQLPPSSAVTLRAIGTRSWTTLTGYVRGTAVNGLVNAVLMSVGLMLLHVPLVPVIAVLTFFGGFFPIVGAFASGGVAAAVALVAKGPGTALFVVGLTIVIHHVEGYLVGPIVLGRAVRLHTIVVLLALAAGGEIGGVFGAFVAVPLTAVIVGIVDELRHGEAARAAAIGAVSLVVTETAAHPVVEKGGS
ncbi:MAG TPA: AI-2E family transporter [Acidimicrobiia bacterium]|nr:AI-2E family transporter [Acidimicrobiia bacterium]